MDFSLTCHVPIDDDSIVENSPALFDDISTTSSNLTSSNTTLNSNKSEFDDNNDWDQNEQNVFLLTELSNHTSIKALPLENWKEKNVFNPIIITIAKLKKLMWEQVQEEIKLIKDNMKKLIIPLDVASNTFLPLTKVYHTLFGLSSFFMYELL